MVFMKPVGISANYPAGEREIIRLPAMEHGTSSQRILRLIVNNFECFDKFPPFNPSNPDCRDSGSSKHANIVSRPSCLQVLHAAILPGRVTMMVTCGNSRREHAPFVPDAHEWGNEFWRISSCHFFSQKLHL